jgi:hypothetical protein
MGASARGARRAGYRGVVVDQRCYSPGARPTEVVLRARRADRRPAGGRRRWQAALRPRRSRMGRQRCVDDRRRPSRSPAQPDRGLDPAHSRVQRCAPRRSQPAAALGVIPGLPHPGRGGARPARRGRAAPVLRWSPLSTGSSAMSLARTASRCSPMSRTGSPSRRLSCSRSLLLDHLAACLSLPGNNSLRCGGAVGGVGCVCSRLRRSCSPAVRESADCALPDESARNGIDPRAGSL